MHATSTAYGFLVTATVMVHVDAGREAAALDQLNAALGGEHGLTGASTVSGMRLTAITLDGVDGLDQVDGVPLDELCRNEECREPLNGDSWDGECGNCADRTWVAESAEVGA